MDIPSGSSIPGHIRKKQSTEISFAEYGVYISDEEDDEPTTENRRVIELNDPVDAMSANKDGTRVVAAGSRGVLQIIRIDDNVFNEGPSIVKDIDVRSYRRGKVNILYSSSNVSWSHLRDELIATTSPNGSIVLWNVLQKNVKENIYKSHERSATAVHFHRNNENLLISGSRDCHVVLYDIRHSSKHVLDFYDGTCEAVRDLSFGLHPGQYDLFFTGDDSGALRLWDLRYNTRPLIQRTAHNAFVSTIALNPNEPRLLATGGGRDKYIKIWDWTTERVERKYAVETMAPLGKVLWRPDKPFHVVSCASVNDMNVHVWDIRRPFIPYATYDEHRDSVTDVFWPTTHNSSNFLSSGKDGLLVLHSVDSGHSPIQYACDVAFDMTPDGVLGIAVNGEIQHKIDNEMEPLPYAAKSAITSRPSQRRPKKRKTQYESFRAPIQSLLTVGVPDNVRNSMQPNVFYEIASRYYLGGKTLKKMCSHNAKIARFYGKEHVAQTWKIVGALVEQAGLQEIYDKDRKEWEEEQEKKWDVLEKELSKEGRNVQPSLQKQIDYLERSERISEVDNIFGYVHKKDPDDDASSMESDPDGPERCSGCLDMDKDIASSDFYFGVGESNFTHIYKKEEPYLNEFMGLRDEAFELRTTIPSQTLITGNENLERERGWTPLHEVVRLLKYHADQGDVQTCASVSIVCGRKLLEVMDSYTIWVWIDSYMGMLDRLELFVTLARIKKYCAIPKIYQMSREGTYVRLVHLDCDAPIKYGSCTKCDVLIAPWCCICKEPISGIFFQCHECFHSSCPHHALDWFAQANHCPSPNCLCPCKESDYPFTPDYQPLSALKEDEQYQCEKMFQQEVEERDDMSYSERREWNFEKLWTFVSCNYWIPWDQLLRPDHSLELRRVYDMWQQFSREYDYCCPSHRNDFIYKSYVRMCMNRMNEILCKPHLPRIALKGCITERNGEPNKNFKRMRVIAENIWDKGDGEAEEEETQWIVSMKNGFRRKNKVACSKPIAYRREDSLMKKMGVKKKRRSGNKKKEKLNRWKSEDLRVKSFPSFRARARDDSTTETEYEGNNDENEVMKEGIREKKSKDESIGVNRRKRNSGSKKHHKEVKNGSPRYKFVVNGLKISARPIIVKTRAKPGLRLKRFNGRQYDCVHVPASATDWAHWQMRPRRSKKDPKYFNPTTYYCYDNDKDDVWSSRKSPFTYFVRRIEKKMDKFDPYFYIRDYDSKTNTFVVKRRLGMIPEETEDMVWGQELAVRHGDKCSKPSLHKIADKFVGARQQELFEELKKAADERLTNRKKKLRYRPMSSDIQYEIRRAERVLRRAESLVEHDRELWLHMQYSIHESRKKAAIDRRRRRRERLENERKSEGDWIRNWTEGKTLRQAMIDGKNAAGVVECFFDVGNNSLLNVYEKVLLLHETSDFGCLKKENPARGDLNKLQMERNLKELREHYEMDSASVESDTLTSSGSVDSMSDSTSVSQWGEYLPETMLDVEVLQEMDVVDEKRKGAIRDLKACFANMRDKDNQLAEQRLFAYFLCNPWPKESEPCPWGPTPRFKKSDVVKEYFFQKFVEVEMRRDQRRKDRGKNLEYVRNWIEMSAKRDGRLRMKKEMRPVILMLHKAELRRRYLRLRKDAKKIFIDWVKNSKNHMKPGDVSDEEQLWIDRLEEIMLIMANYHEKALSNNDFQAKWSRKAYLKKERAQRNGEIHAGTLRKLKRKPKKKFVLADLAKADAKLKRDKSIVETIKEVTELEKKEVREAEEWMVAHVKQEIEKREKFAKEEEEQFGSAILKQELPHEDKAVVDEQVICGSHTMTTTELMKAFGDHDTTPIDTPKRQKSSDSGESMEKDDDGEKETDEEIGVEYEFDDSDSVEHDVAKFELSAVNDMIFEMEKETPYDEDDALSYKSLQHCTTRELKVARDTDVRIIPAFIMVFDVKLLFRGQRTLPEMWKKLVKEAKSGYEMCHWVTHLRLVEAAIGAFVPYLERIHGKRIFMPGLFDTCSFLGIFDNEMRPYQVQIECEDFGSEGKKKEYLMDVVNKSRSDMATWMSMNHLCEENVTALKRVDPRDHTSWNILELPIDEKVRYRFEVVTEEDAKKIFAAMRELGINKFEDERIEKVFGRIIDKWYKDEEGRRYVRRNLESEYSFGFIQKFAYELHRVFEDNPELGIRAVNIAPYYGTEVSGEKYVAWRLHNYIYPFIGPQTKKHCERTDILINIVRYGNPNGTYTQMKPLSNVDFDCTADLKKLRSQYEAYDARRRIANANATFNLAAMLMERTCELADVKRARDRWNKTLSTLHMRQAPLIRQMEDQDRLFEKFSGDDKKLEFLYSCGFLPKGVYTKQEGVKSDEPWFIEGWTVEGMIEAVRNGLVEPDEQLWDYLYQKYLELIDDISKMDAELADIRAAKAKRAASPKPNTGHGNLPKGAPIPKNVKKVAQKQRPPVQVDFRTSIGEDEGGRRVTVQNQSASQSQHPDAEHRRRMRALQVSASAKKTGGKGWNF